MSHSIKDISRHVKNGKKLATFFHNNDVGIIVCFLGQFM